MVQVVTVEAQRATPTTSHARAVIGGLGYLQWLALGTQFIQPVNVCCGVQQHHSSIVWQDLFVESYRRFW